MRLLIAAFAALLFLGVLWGPAFAVALRYWRRGDARAFRQLRWLYPAQLITTVSLAFAADLLGLRHPAALAAASTACVGLAGAGALALRLSLSLDLIRARADRAEKTF
ncbi:hypothetical protein [Duganella violaceipulchra]|uniref:Uncharacterized protein n=1 Tax=Duganella violaceipulchra TaxID=2849652 RepID=A0AA41H873_9BURK|nr:hypothetical protein [Duganella violaceicalia]MBV6322379.1 hypothetical protein [Duganella violaceicalia]MCP2011526.1 hypothetical protein [Duganella violaceicalia]